MKRVTNLSEAVQAIQQQESEGELRLATPLGLGKPNPLLNQVYEAYKATPSRRLKIYTALSLDFPQAQPGLEKKFIDPFLERHYGKDYPRLHYVRDLKNGSLPSHIHVHEFYFQAGQYKKVTAAQTDYVSLNYTHVARALLEDRIQVVALYIAKRPSHREGPPYSLSCNPDIALDLADLFAAAGRKLFMVGVVHPDLPYMGGEAAVEESFFDLLVESPEIKHQLFSLPKNSIEATDHMIGLHASLLMPDDGTFQVGIGSLSDALVTSLLLRHQDSSRFRQITQDFLQGRSHPKSAELHFAPFEQGLYGTSEMMMDAFMHLRRAGILKRTIFDVDENHRRYLHAAFFLGSKEFYAWLRDLEGEDFSGISMTRVSKVNDLYDPHELALRRQRQRARFYNTCMQVTVLGGAVSDTLADGEVVSGVGGQYNFVAMSQELSDSHSVLMLRSTRHEKGRRVSNIVAEGGQLSIPRHLRDVVVTEYGIACLRGRTDGECIAALIEIADAEFQAELVEFAKRHHKLPMGYQIPSYARLNTPRLISDFVGRHQQEGLFKEDPFGSDFTTLEIRLKTALLKLKSASPKERLGFVLSGLSQSDSSYREELKRMDMVKTHGLSEKLQRFALLGALHSI